MFDAVIKTIPHDKQRYETVGDYRTCCNGVLTVTVSNLGDWRMEFLVAMHELIEKAITKRGGVSEAEIDKFDLASEADEPGNDPKAPYYRAHQIATLIEGALAIELGVDWHDYDEKVRTL